MSKRSPTHCACLLVPAFLAILVISGCDGDAQQKERQRLEAQIQEYQRQVEEQNARIHELQQQAQQTRRVLEARKAEAESDAWGAALLWAASGLALVISVFLLARERFVRRIMERLIRRLHGSRERSS